MYALGFFLLIISLTKLCLSASSNILEMKELVYHNPVLAQTPPGLVNSLIVMDGLVGLICSLIILITL